MKKLLLIFILLPFLLQAQEGVTNPSLKSI
jgi:hypothetical protein